MAEMFLQPIIEMLISGGLRYVKDQVGWQKRAKEVLDKLKDNLLPKIEAVVHFASSQAQITEEYPGLNKWLWLLRDAIDDAKDVLDELEYMELEKQLPRTDEKPLTENKKLRRVRSIMKSTKKKLVRIGKRALTIDPTLKRLEEVVQKLDQISTTGVDTFYHLVKDAKKEVQKQQLELHETRETGSLHKNDLIGRVKEKELVMEWLRNPSNEHGGTDLLYNNISLLSIVGHGGMGKTTLLQHVYKDEKITMDFDPKMWVCVSDNFNMKKVIADMLESLKKERPRLDTLDALQGTLKEEVMSKKFLLVLDDVWEDDEEKDKRKWEDVLSPLASGKFGSKILITTRMDSVAQMFAKLIKKKKEIVKLEGLKEDECLELLNSHAFAGVESDDHANLRVIAREIVKKLLRSPLAAKVIGGVLNNDLDERHWRTVLKSHLLGENSINSILRLSYIVLPNHLQNCFAICCMFPQDHEYDKDDIVRMWIALGFIHSSQGMTMEDIGGRYFDIFVKKSLFDKVRHNYEEEYYYKMHDLIHESASKFFAQECGKLVDDREKSYLEISATIRHLSVQNAKPDMLKKIEKFKHLHSLFLIFEASNQDFCSALIKIVLASTCLRVLYIYTPTWKKLEMIPEEIKYLKHLRYLNIKRIILARLPRSLSILYHLQYIIHNQLLASGDNFLPSDIHNLSNLRYMELSENYIASICGIGKLKSLQELHKFYLRNEDGYRIEELKNMNDLWKLGIYRLENVKDAEEACSARLYVKTRLSDLTLSWYNIDLRSIDLYGSVLDNLQPPECLRNLSIKNYKGARYAIWMNNVNLISNLEKIELKSCEWETLPHFGQLPFLKSLKLIFMPRVKWLGSKFDGNDKYRVFPLLEELHISFLEVLEDWFEGGIAVEDGCLFPSLIKLHLWSCPKLKELPSLPPKLKTLTIDRIWWKTLNFCSNSNPIPLETLVVDGCPNMTSLPLADEIARLAALRDLYIINCPNLISLGEMPITNNCHLLMLSHLLISDPSVLLMEPLKSNTSLKRLKIESNYNLVSFTNEAEQWFLNVNVSSSLSELQFRSLKSLQSLPSSLESLSSLRSLTIWNVPMLRELRNLPPSMESLEGLTIYDVPMLRELPNLPPSLERLRIEHVPMLRELQNLPPSLKFLDIHDVPMLRELRNLPPSLKSLKIEDVPMLRELPNLPPSLESLSIWRKCHPELKERYREDGGSDRHKIAHIPHIRIHINT